MTSRIFLNPNHAFCTLDDDFFGTRAADNQVVTISNRKADREVHSADVVADALFRIVLHIRFHRRSDKREVSVKNLIRSLLENRGEQCLKGMLLTLDRGFASQSLVATLLECDIACVCIMQEYHIKCHSFVARSYLKAGKAEESEAEDWLNDRSHSEGDVARTNVQSDRRREFIIDDGPQQGPKCFRALKNVKPQAKDPLRVTAVAIREFGNKKHSNILRFLHTLPANFDRSLMTWTATPHTSDLKGHLFRVKNKYGKILLRAHAEGEDQDRFEDNRLEDNIVLTVGQRCADWFVLCQFRLTATTSAEILRRLPYLRQRINWAPSEKPDHTVAEIQALLSTGWFSTTHSTEAMIRGTLNESPVVSALRKMDYLEYAWEVGLCTRRDMHWIACSLDGIALLRPGTVAQRSGADIRLNPALANTNAFVLSVIEIKTRVSGPALQRAAILASASLICCEFGDAVFNKYVPEDHAAQLSHQLLVLLFSHALYVVASESQILYIVLAFMPNEIAAIVENFFVTKATPILKWAHHNPVQAHGIQDQEIVQTVSTKFPFWFTINSEVMKMGPFVPVRLFRHSLQTMYSKTKGGVDGSAQCRAIMRRSTDSLKREQKIVTLVLKSISVNARIAWRMLEKEELLQDVESFQNLDHYRDSLNKVQSLSDFVHDAAHVLLGYADELEKERRVTIDDDDVIRNQKLGRNELSRLMTLAKQKQRYRLEFFNSADGFKLRVSVKTHDHLRMDKELFCILCGRNKANKFRGHRSSTKCKQCDVHLCVKPQPGYRRSCWDVWHSVKVVNKRVAVGTRQEGTDDSNVGTGREGTNDSNDAHDIPENQNTKVRGTKRATSFNGRRISKRLRS